MAFASIEDVNLHLPDDKIEVDTARYAPLQLDAERIVRGYMAGIFSPTILASWDTPANTPGLIRAITARFVAAFYYRERYSEDSLEDPQYAQNKYNEAMYFIDQIILGKMVIAEVDDDAGTGDHFTGSGDFWPNNSTEGPYFTMAGEL